METRLTVHFAGRVQGVGFRFTARRIARGFDVTGYVTNLADGRVECVVEGERDEVERFVAEVRRAMAGYVIRATVVESPVTGEFDGFGVGG